MFAAFSPTRRMFALRGELRLLLVAIGILLGVSAETEDHVQTLLPGQVVARELAAGETHTFRFELNAGEMLEATLEQQGVDLSITVLDPTGGSVLSIDSTPNPMLPERVLWIAQTRGTHSLRIAVVPERGGGRYRIVLVSPWLASPTDDSRVSAQRDYEHAITLRKEKENAGARSEALRRLEAARTAFHAAGDSRGEAEAMGQLSSVELDAGRAERALATAQGALVLQRELGNRPAEAANLQRIARAHRALGDPGRALVYASDAVRIAREIANAWAEAVYLNTVGTLCTRLGDAERAIEAFDMAVVQSRATGNRENEALSLMNRGIAYYRLGDYETAVESYQAALTLFQAATDAFNESVVYNNMGNVFVRTQNYHEAREVFVRYLAIAHERDPGGDDEARALNNLSTVSLRLGAPSEALEYARRSLDLKIRLADLRGQASALSNIGKGLHAVGRSEDAVASLREALRIIGRVGERYYEPDALLALAIVERDRGHLREALAAAERALKLTEDLRAAVTNPDLRASFIAAEEDKYGFYIELLMRRHEQEPRAGHDATALLTSERARARILLEALIEARADVRQGVEPSLLDRERALQKELNDAGDLLSRVLVREGATQDVAQARRAFEAKTEEYRQVQARIRRESPRYAALTQPVPASLEEIRRDVLDDETVLLEFYIGDERSFLWAVTRSDLVSQALPGRAQIEAAARRVHALLTERQRTRAPAAVKDADRRLESESMAMSRLLLAGIGPRLATDWKGKRLLVVASGALAYLPFGALPSPAAATSRPLLLDHEIVYTPSASVLVALRQERDRKPAAAGTMAVLADPVFEAADPRVHSNASAKAAPRPTPSTGLTRAMDSLGRQRFSRLPFSRQEADAIAAFVPRRELLRATDFEANRALVTERGLGDRRVVHFATHGLLNSEHPDLSGLVLSLVDETGAPHDGFLRMHEIYNLRLPADLVVLSACQTALGREIRGEGLMGLTRGFMYAGARRVVASLWQVDDESTAELMKRFYRGMLKEGRRPPDALRNAQLELSRDRRWSAPFHWAGFVLQGEWR
jgi:CHAT domain-containing protein